MVPERLLGDILRPRGLPARVAHDSGDGEEILHCPFCGAGQVIGRSDNSAECEFCGQCFTVQVQPRYPGFPQSVNGMPVPIPGMPGQPGGAPGVPPGGGGLPGEEGAPVPGGGPGDQGEQPGGPAEDDGGADDDGSDDKPAFLKGKSAAAARDHEDMSGPQMRYHMRAEHGFRDSPDDPDWLIEETHRQEHADAPAGHTHPDLEAEHDLDLPLSDRDWLGQHGIQAARRGSYRTSRGDVLAEEAFLRYLAMELAPDRAVMAALLRAEARGEGLPGSIGRSAPARIRG